MYHINLRLHDENSQFIAIAIAIAFGMAIAIHYSFNIFGMRTAN